MINGLREGPIEAVALAQRIRRFRGRLTKSQITEKLGFKHRMTGYLTVCRVCTEFEITTADLEEDYRPRVVTRDQTVELAAEQLRREIEAAQQEAATAPPYRPGPLIWAQEEERDRLAQQKYDRRSERWRAAR